MMYLYVALYCLTGIFEFVAGLLMLFKRKRHRDRSRLLISLFFLLTTVVIAFIVGMMLSGKYIKGEHVLGTGAIITGFSLFFLLLLYPLEVLRPNWLNARRLLCLLSPWLFFAIMLLCLVPAGYTELHSPSDIIRNISRSDVLLRIILALIFIPYGVWLLIIHYNWRNSSAPRAWIHAIVLIAMTMTITFSLNRLFGFHWTIYMHILLYNVLTVVILLMEFRVRFKVPDNTETVLEGESSAGAVAEEKKVAKSVKTTPELVRDKLIEAMEKPEIWQNPDLTRGMLCNIIGTNTNYLQKAIKELGYASYSEMLNCKRVEYVRREIEGGCKDNIQDIFYRAGYRSRVTAWRNFTAITGSSPTSIGPMSDSAE